MGFGKVQKLNQVVVLEYVERSRLSSAQRHRNLGWLHDCALEQRRPELSL